MKSSIPDKKVGYEAPASYNYKKVKNPNGRKGYGWLDAQSNVWVVHQNKNELNVYWDVEMKEGSYKHVEQLQPFHKKIKEQDELRVTAQGIIFYSKNDEETFFEWIKNIACIDLIKWNGDTLFIYVSCLDLHDNDLRDLLALFYRYKIDMKQLKRFLTEDNRKWFSENKRAYWYSYVFEDVSFT